MPGGVSLDVTAEKLVTIVHRESTDSSSSSRPKSKRGKTKLLPTGR